MAKTPTKKKKYVVTYYRLADFNKAEKSDSSIPLRKIEIEALSPEDAVTKASTPARVVLEAKTRGRGGLKKSSDFFTFAEAGTKAAKFSPAPGTSTGGPFRRVDPGAELERIKASHSRTPSYSGGGDFFDGSAKAGVTKKQARAVADSIFPDPSLDVVTVPEDEAPLDAIGQAFEALSENSEFEDGPAEANDLTSGAYSKVEAFNETPDLTSVEVEVGKTEAQLDPVAEPVAELTDEEKEADFEAKRQTAIEKIEGLIRIRTMIIDSKERRLDILEAASQRSLNVYQDMEVEIHDLENRLNLRPIAIETLTKYLGEVPDGIETTDETVDDDVADLRSEVTFQAYFDQCRYSEIVAIEETLDKDEEELRSLKFLLSELTGEPFDEEDEDAEDDEQEFYSEPTPKTSVLSFSNIFTVLTITFLFGSISVGQLDNGYRTLATFLLILLTASVVRSKGDKDDEGDYPDHEG